MTDTEANPKNVLIARRCAEIGYFGLIVLILCWQIWLSPHPHVNPTVTAILWLIPLIFPLKGMIKANPYTHAWSSFVACLYVTHALVQFYTEPAERYLAAVEFILVSMWLVGSIFYARWRGRQLGLGLKKKKPQGKG
ncbi:DUF2069 domain-containing protein [Echinimonas agarilytica]|uniref:DUF2069 domain-containing protein n=1 Tax=Echinimonas agarilytica TaxID=1215918 RepID=A0AA41W5X3_9GAMM|nr:DUF2069 domain-containing protein [Echinimonas agarilytica]MCM2679280.1 DUF2069 domain-containing protein [Echinimonas agarilytica]